MRNFDIGSELSDVLIAVALVMGIVVLTSVLSKCERESVKERTKRIEACFATDGPAHECARLGAGG